MDPARKFSPHPHLGPLKRASMALHVVLPAVAFVVIFGRHEVGAGWWTWIVAVAAYLIYLIFAIVLHKEYFPESRWLAWRLWLLPLVFGLLLFRWFGASVGAWLSAAGLVMFTGLQAAVSLLLMAGTHLAARDPDAAPGESPLRWNAEGRSPFRDPHLPPMARWTLGLFFLLPGGVVLVSLVCRLAANVNGVGNSVFLVTLFLVVIALATWSYLRLLVGMTQQGRIFGPGKAAFD